MIGRSGEEQPILKRAIIHTRMRADVHDKATQELSSEQGTASTRQVVLL